MLRMLHVSIEKQVVLQGFLHVIHELRWVEALIAAQASASRFEFVDRLRLVLETASFFDSLLSYSAF